MKRARGTQKRNRYANQRTDIAHRQFPHLATLAVYFNMAADVLPMNALQLDRERIARMTIDSIISHSISHQFGRARSILLNQTICL